MNSCSRTRIAGRKYDGLQSGRHCGFVCLHPWLVSYPVQLLSSFVFSYEITQQGYSDCLRCISSLPCPLQSLQALEETGSPRVSPGLRPGQRSGPILPCVGTLFYSYHNRSFRLIGHQVRYSAPRLSSWVTRTMERFPLRSLSYSPRLGVPQFCVSLEAACFSTLRKRESTQ